MAAADRHHEWNQRAIYSNLVHMHESLVRDTSDNEFFFMTVRADVAAGSLLLLELVMSGTAKDLVGMIGACAAQYDALCPREIGDRSVLALSKVEDNCFHSQPQHLPVGDASNKHNAWYHVGNVLSGFNHSCHPNAIVFQTACAPAAVGDIPTVFFAVYARRDIRAGAEVCISYGKAIGHSKKQKAEIRCADADCTPERRAAPLQRDARVGCVEHLSRLHEYMSTAQFRRALAFRLLAEVGCYFVGDVIAPSRKKSQSAKSRASAADFDENSAIATTASAPAAPAWELPVAAPTRKFAQYAADEAALAHCAPPDIIRRDFDATLARVCARLDAAAPESLLMVVAD